MPPATTNAGETRCEATVSYKVGGEPGPAGAKELRAEATAIRVEDACTQAAAGASAKLLERLAG